MSFLEHICVLIITFNEDPNIGRTLDALAAFSEIVVLDSGSTDDTQAIVARYANARLVTRAFDDHASQWNFALCQTGITRPWVLALDADYVLPAACVDEIAQLAPSDDIDGFAAGFRYCIGGRPLSATLYPSATVLYRRTQARYIQTGHTQRIVVTGATGMLRARIDHDDRKPLARWLDSQRKYARLEACYLVNAAPASLGRTGRLRRMAWPAPLLVFVYTLIVKRCILNGRVGWFYVLQRTLAEIMIALEVLEARLGAQRSQTRRQRRG